MDCNLMRTVYECTKDCAKKEKVGYGIFGMKICKTNKQNVKIVFR